MTIRLRLKSKIDATGTGYNLNGANPKLVDWMLDDEGLTLQERMYPAERRMESLQVQVKDTWIALADSIVFGFVKVDESNGGLSYENH